jgi:hypothetical protein
MSDKTTPAEPVSPIVTVASELDANPQETAEIQEASVDPTSLAGIQNMLNSLLGGRPKEETELAMSHKPQNVAPWHEKITGKAKQSVGQDVQELSIKTVFRISNIVQSLVQAELVRATTILKSPIENAAEELADPSGDNAGTLKSLREKLFEKSSAASLLCALHQKSADTARLEPWEVASQTKTLTDLKAGITIKAAAYMEPYFHAACLTPEGQENMGEALKIFREASRAFEIGISAKSNMQVGPGKAILKIHGKLPPKAVEIMACLTQIALDNIRNSFPSLGAEGESQLRDLQTKSRRALAFGYSASDSNEQTQRKAIEGASELLAEAAAQDRVQQFEDSIVQWKNGEGAPLAEKTSTILAALFGNTNLPEAQKELLEKTRLASVESPFQNDPSPEGEWTTIRELEKIHAKMDAAIKKNFPGDDLPDATTMAAKEPRLELRVLAAIMREAPALGAGSRIVLTHKILSSKPLTDRFVKTEAEDPENILEAFGFIQETLSIQTDAGRTLQSRNATQEERDQLQALVDLANTLEYADSLIHSKEVLRTTNSQRRQDLQKVAEKVMNEESTSHPEAPALQKSWEEIQKNIGRVEEILSRETEISRVPAMLQGLERTQALHSSAARLISRAQENAEDLEKLSQDEALPEQARQAASALLLIAEKSLDANSNDLWEMETNLVSTSYQGEALGNLIAKFCESRDKDGNHINLEELSFHLKMLKSERSAPTLTPEKVQEIIQAEEAKPPGEGKVPFSEIPTPMLAAVVEASNNGMARAQLSLRSRTQFLRDAWIIRHHREKTQTLSADQRLDLGTKLCQIPKELSASCRSEIIQSLEACCSAPRWNNHQVMPPQVALTEFKEINRSYALMRDAYKEIASPTRAEKDLMASIQRILSKTEEIHKGTKGRWAQSEELAKALQEPDGELRSQQVQAFKALVDSPKASPLIAPAVKFLQDWSSYTGNREALLKESILLPKEKKAAERSLSSLYLASMLETHLANLKEIHSYMKAVTQTPRAFAETHLTHERNTRMRSQHGAASLNAEWKSSMDDKRAALEEEAKALEAEMASMQNIFEAKVDDAKGMEEGLERDEFLNPRLQQAFNNLMNQKEQELRILLIRISRMNKMVEMATGVSEDKAKDKEEVEGPKKYDSISHALDAALASSKQKLILPKEVGAYEINTSEILDASRAQRMLEMATTTLEEAATKLREFNPKASEILDEITPDNLKESCLKLKSALYDAIKSCETLVMESGDKNRNVVIDRLKAQMLEEDPEIRESETRWATELRKTHRGMITLLAGKDEKEVAKPSRSKGRKADHDQRPEVQNDPVPQHAE